MYYPLPFPRNVFSLRHRRSCGGLITQVYYYRINARLGEKNIRPRKRYGYRIIAQRTIQYSARVKYVAVEHHNMAPNRNSCSGGGGEITIYTHPTKKSFLPELVPKVR